MTRNRNVLLGCALLGVLQLTYLAETLTLPFLDGPLYDSVVYLAQAKAVAAGDHGAPALLAFSPLYGYFLAAVGGQAAPLTAVLVQFLLGAVALWLTWQIARRWFGDKAAWAAVAVQATYGLLLFYQGKLLSETLGVTLTLGAYALFASAGFRQGKFGVALASGLLLGLGVMARASLLFNLPFFGLAALLPWSRNGAPFWRRFSRAAGLTLGVLLIIGVRGGVTKAETGIFVPFIMVSSTVEKTTAQAGWTGKLNQTVGHKATAWDVVNEAKRRLESGEAEGLRKPQLDIGGWLRGAPPKLVHALADREINYMYGYYGERSESRILGVLPTTFHVVLLLGLVGLGVLIRRDGWAAMLPVLPLVLGTLVTVTLFHPSSRYRLPIVLALLPLTGAGLTWLARWRGAPPKALVLRGLIVAVGLVSMGRTVFNPVNHPARWHVEVAYSAAQAGDIRTMAARLERAEALAPDDPSVRDAIQELRRRN